MPGLTLGSWPGRESDHNRFLPILLDALETEGVRIVSFPESRAIRVAGLDVLIIHWPDKVFWEAKGSIEAAGLITRLMVRLALRPQSVKLIWMVHDLRPHDGRWFKSLAWPPYAAMLARLVDGALVLSSGTRAAVQTAFPVLARKPFEHIWHPAYPGEGSTPKVRAATRADFGWGSRERVFGYCGQLRPYKGVEDLITAFVGLADRDARLLIAGLPRDPGIAATLEDLARGDSRIHLKFANLSSGEFRACLAACDLIVAPFRHYLHSGSIVHALSAGRPVLTPATAFATSLGAELGSVDWLQTYAGPLTPAILAEARDPAIPLDLTPLAPEIAAKRICRFLETIIGRTPEAP